MKKKHSINLTLFFLTGILFTGMASTALATPMILNFQIEDPLGGQYDKAEFSYIIDKETPFWSYIEGYNYNDQNRFKYHVDLYQADPVLGSLPDLTLHTGYMVGDVECGGNYFYSGSEGNGDRMEIWSLTTWYLWDLIDYNHSNRPIKFQLYSQPLDLIPSLVNFAWLISVEPAHEPVPEPATVFLFGTGIAVLVRKQYRDKAYRAITKK